MAARVAMRSGPTIVLWALYQVESARSQTVARSDENTVLP
jgi:hypothetical protein